MEENELKREATFSPVTAFGIRREPLADVISSPELPRYTSALRSHATARSVRKGGVASTPSYRTSSSQRQKHAECLLSERSLKARVLESDNGANKAPPLLPMEEDEDDNEEKKGEKKNVPLTLLSSDKTTASSSCISERDSLLERLQEKEKQFDEKIAVLDETLSCAEKGRAQRDNIISSLRAEVARLREQLELAAGAKSQTEVLRERILTERTLALDEARTKIEDLDSRLQAKDRRIRQLEIELIEQKSTIKAREQEKVEARATEVTRSKVQKRHQSTMTTPNITVSGVEKERKRCERYVKSLREMRNEVHGLEQNHCIVVKEKESLAEENHALRCKLEAIQEGMEARVAGAVKTMHKNTGFVHELEAELMTTRLSMARLLRILNEVPEMRRYLRVEGIDDDVIFAGYKMTTTVPMAATGRKLLLHDDALQRQRNDGLLVASPETGVDDGIYGGNSLLQSCNIYLNGQWWKQLKDIVNDESYFLRRARINVGDLEDAVQCSRGDGFPRLPSPRDVLQGRQHEKDFWIPYAVFVEAQKFKNRHFPSMKYECFYPFLIAINRVWNERMKRRVATEMRRRLQDQRREHKNKQKEMKKGTRTSSAEISGEACLMSSSALALWQQLQSLRSDVRCRITGRNSLELFHLYDQLAQSSIQHLQQVQQEHAALLEGHRHRYRVDRVEEEMNHVDHHHGKAYMGESEGGGDVDGNDNNKDAVRLQHTLSALIEDVQEVSERVSSRISASCRDLKQFLMALRDQQLGVNICEQKDRKENLVLSYKTSSNNVPSTTLLRILDGVLDFVEEVQQEILMTRDAMLRCTARADGVNELLFDVSGCENPDDSGDTDMDDRDYDHDIGSEDDDGDEGPQKGCRHGGFHHRRHC